jgi:hypothetical protein
MNAIREELGETLVECKSDKDIKEALQVINTEFKISY